MESATTKEKPRLSGPLLQIPSAGSSKCFFTGPRAVSAPLGRVSICLDVSPKRGRKTLETGISNLQMEQTRSSAERSKTSMIQDHIYRSRDRLESILVAASDRPGPPRHVPHTLLIDLEGPMQASDITVCHRSPRKCQVCEAT